jgi:two-component system, OmpR family, sensor histidine kinase ChvG
MKADVDKPAKPAAPRNRTAETIEAIGKLREKIDSKLSGFSRRLRERAPGKITAPEKQPDPPEETPASPLPAGQPGRWSDFVSALGQGRRFAASQGFSSISRRIALLNLAGLVVLVTGILYLSEYRAGLIDARIQSLQIQGEIIAAAIASSGTGDSNSVRINPERLLELQQGETYDPNEDWFTGAGEFSISPEQAAPLLRRLVSPTDTRARLYDRDGALMIDTRTQYQRGDVLRFDLPLPQERPGWLQRQWNSVMKRVVRGDLPTYREHGLNGKGYSEVVNALIGGKSSMVRVTDRGEVIVSVAVPVQRFRGIYGALLLSTEGGEIEDAVEAERIVILSVFGIAALVMLLLSILLASTIGGPLQRLAAAAERVRRRTRQRVEIPDFSGRADEVGHLSGAIRDMTNSLYSRIEAIESFAADVAHELKNPLTSLRSAVETLPLAKTEDARKRLLAVIEHDVRRLDRLISDISDASRLDAELQRNEASPVDLEQLLTAIVKIRNEVPHDGVPVKLAFDTPSGAREKCIVLGQDTRIGQVIDNLVSNARSFSPPEGSVRITCRRLKDEIEIMVDDDGPGISPDAFTKIFERFYTDRPEHRFGQNSGLGLSISRQIIDGHGGKIWAENRTAPGAAGEEPKILGARFIIRLPTA